jgi:hypothetical protein
MYKTQIKLSKILLQDIPNTKVKLYDQKLGVAVACGGKDSSDNP